MRLALELGMDLRGEFDDLGTVRAGDVHGGDVVEMSRQI
jgi:hypothetical protein